MTPSKLISSKEARERLGVSPATIRRWARTGKIRAIRTPGGHFRFDSATIEALASQEVSSDD